jgi:hypothetical protein
MHVPMLRQTDACCHGAAIPDKPSERAFRCALRQFMAKAKELG